MPTFSAFMLVGTLWLQNGTPQPVVAYYTSLETCKTAESKFVAIVEGSNDQNGPTERLTYHLEPCRLIINDSEAAPS